MRFKPKFIAALVVPAAICVLFAFALYQQHSPPDFLDPDKTAAYTNLIALVSEIVRTSQPAYANDFLVHESQIATLNQALKNPSEAPDAAYNVATLPRDFMVVRILGRSVIATAQDAELKGRYKEAAELYIAAFRLASRFEHGPLIYFLVGSSIERPAIRQIKTLIPNLSAAELSGFAKDLQFVNRERVPVDDMIRRERYYISRNAKNIVEFARTHLSVRSSLNKAASNHAELNTELEGITAAAAILAYSRENQTPLTNLQSLVPKYLKSIPIDPHNGAPLPVLFTASGVVVYSVGPNKIDESGVGDDIAFFFDDTKTR